MESFWKSVDNITIMYYYCYVKINTVYNSFYTFVYRNDLSLVNMYTTISTMQSEYGNSTAKKKNKWTHHTRTVVDLYYIVVIRKNEGNTNYWKTDFDEQT